MGLGDFFFGKDPEKYDPNTAAAQAARTLGGPQHQYDATAASANGANLTAYNDSKAQQQTLAGNLASTAAGQGPSGAAMAGQAQRDASLQQAAALQAGRRGQSAGMGIRQAGTQMNNGIQQASQNEAIGRANEMATARGQQAGVLGSIAGQDLNVANMGQQNNQYNAGLQQQAGLANQAAQLGISNAEMQARQQQQGYLYGNLNPGQAGLLSPSTVATGIAAGATMMSDKRSKTKITPLDSSTGVAMSPRDAKTDIMQLPGLAGGGPSGQQAGGVQLMSPGQRVMPNWNQNSAGAYGNAIGSALASALLNKAMEKKDEDQKNLKSFQAAEQRGHAGDALHNIPTIIGSQSPVVIKPTTSAQLQIDPDTFSNYANRFSDPKSKTDVKPAAAQEMFEETKPYSYFYKPDAVAAGAPQGRQVSVMWDDLQKTPEGKKMDGGKEVQTGYHTVDYLKGLPALFAQMSNVTDAISKLNTRKK